MLKCFIFVSILALSHSHALASSCSYPEALNFSIVPSTKSSNEISSYAPLVSLLESITELPISVKQYSSYAEVVYQLINDNLDIVILGPYSYIAAKEKLPQLELIATFSKKPGIYQEAGGFYRSLLIVNASSAFTDLTSLKNSLLALQNSYSTSGFTVPKKIFSQTIGTPIEIYFKSILFSKGHDNAIRAVLENKVDAAFIASSRLENMVQNGQADPKDIRVLWQSPPIPQEPIVIRPGLCQELKEKIINVFLNPEKHLSGQQLMEKLKIDGFTPIDDEAYDFIRILDK